MPQHLHAISLTKVCSIFQTFKLYKCLITQLDPRLHSVAFACVSTENIVFVMRYLWLWYPTRQSMRKINCTSSLHEFPSPFFSKGTQTIVLNQVHFMENSGKVLVSNSERLQSSDGSAQDQGMNVMSSCRKKMNKLFSHLDIFELEVKITVLVQRIRFLNMYKQRQ